MKATLAKFAKDKKVSHVFFSIGKFSVYSQEGIRILSLPTKLINFLIPIAHWYFDALVIHGFFHSFFLTNYLSLSSKIKVLAIFWGFDLYSLKGKRQSYFLPQTLSTFKKKGNIMDNFQSPDFELFLHTRVDFVSTVIPNEFKILSSNFPAAKFKHSWFSYFDLENDVLNGIADLSNLIGDNLLLGNNASYWNNHLDAISLIKSFKFRFEKVICPMSYSGAENYRVYVVEQLKKEFGSKVFIISEFMDYEEYTKILLSCRFVFFNSTRQIGLGNLLLAIYIGCSVILNSSNPLYSYFISIGVKVYSIEEALVANDLSVNVNENRKYLELQFGERIVRDRTSQVVRELVSC